MARPLRLRTRYPRPPVLTPAALSLPRHVRRAGHRDRRLARPAHTMRHPQHPRRLQRSVVRRTAITDRAEHSQFVVGTPLGRGHASGRSSVVRAATSLVGLQLDVATARDESVEGVGLARLDVVAVVTFQPVEEPFGVESLTVLERPDVAVRWVVAVADGMASWRRGRQAPAIPAGLATPVAWSGPTRWS